MANSNVPMFIQTVQTWPLQITNANGTSAETVLTAGANGSRVTSLTATTTDTTAHDVQLFIYNGTTSFLLGTISVPLSSGNIDSAPSVNLLASTQIAFPTDANGNPYIDLKAGEILQAALLVAAASGKFVNIIGMGGDF